MHEMSTWTERWQKKISHSIYVIQLVNTWPFIVQYLNSSLHSHSKPTLRSMISLAMAKFFFGLTDKSVRINLHAPQLIFSPVWSKVGQLRRGLEFAGNYFQLWLCYGEDNSNLPHQYVNYIHFAEQKLEQLYIAYGWALYHISTTNLPWHVKPTEESQAILSVKQQHKTNQINKGWWNGTPPPLYTIFLPFCQT